MPQASQATKDWYKELHGKDPWDDNALEYLESVGIRDVGGLFTITQSQYDDDKIRACLIYLWSEWDYAWRMTVPDNPLVPGGSAG
jgi:hypothetical protein